jgi:hypothetical protein
MRLPGIVSGLSVHRFISAPDEKHPEKLTFMKFAIDGVAEI